MPSGAKKRKAAKKKLEKQSNYFIKDSNNNGSHSHSNSNKGSDEPKFHEERDGDVEREGIVESDVNNHGNEDAKEVSFGEGKVTEEVKQQEESFEDFVQTGDAAREFQSVTSKTTSSSGSGSNSTASSSSSSDDDEVAVEKEKFVERESGKVEPQDEALSEEVAMSAEYVEASVDNSVEEFMEGSIPTEESVKQVVSVPEEFPVVSESVPVDDMSTSDVIASGLKQNVDEVIQSFEKSEVDSGVIDLVQSKILEKVMPVVDVGSENTSEPVVVTARNDEDVLPQSSGVKAVEVQDNGKSSETHRHTEEEPLLSSAPVAVQRTSWMNCCGLLEVFSGGSR